jgi:long-chain acyl-CoA synthetase
MAGRGPFSIEVPGVQKVDGETIPRRHPAAKDGLHESPSPDVKTIFDIVKVASAKFGNAKALGWRKVVKVHTETKKVSKVVDGQNQEVDKKWNYFELGPYNYLSYVEYEKIVLQVGAGLRKLGLEPGDRIHHFASTSPQWLGMSHAAASQSIPIATAYDALGPEGLKHALKQTRAKASYCDPSLFGTLGKALREAKDVRVVIYNSEMELNQNDLDKLKSDFEYLQVLSFEELRKLGEANPVDPVPPNREDICCIMYTSGTTGAPKGVQIKHKQVVSAIAGVTSILGQYFGPSDALLTYLPLAHIIEYVAENAFLFFGTTMGYGSPKTLSDASVRNCKGDMREFKPTILIGVPAVWESVKKGILTKVEAGGAVTKNVFWGAVAAKSFLSSNGLPGGAVIDNIIFKKLKDATGGRLKFCMNGGGPISKETQRFISMTICPMIGGYGLTETTGMGAILDPTHWTDKAIGELPASIEIKLVDFPEAGYFSTNKPPQGEVWIRGPPVMTEYFENEQETKANITDDGWFKTGDIGEFDQHGLLKIIDRKKNLVKTQNGEYIALEKLESIYRSSKVVANICVYASPDQVKPIAIVSPLEPALKKLASQNGISGDTVEELCANKKMRSIVLKELQTAGKEGGLVGIEIVDGVVLSDEEWTPINGYVTAAQKIQRKTILSKYQKEVDATYAGTA